MEGGGKKRGKFRLARSKRKEIKNQGIHSSSESLKKEKLQGAGLNSFDGDFNVVQKKRIYKENEKEVSLPIPL